MTVGQEYEENAEFFLKELQIFLEEGEAALLTLEVTGFAEADKPACVEDPRTYSYIVENASSGCGIGGINAHGTHGGGVGSALGALALPAL